MRYRIFDRNGGFFIFGFGAVGGAEGKNKKSKIKNCAGEGVFQQGFLKGKRSGLDGRDGKNEINGLNGSYGRSRKGRRARRQQAARRCV